MVLAKKRTLAQNLPKVYFLYDLAVRLTTLLLRIPALFNPKIRLFLQGRKTVWEYLGDFREPGRPLIWMHTASLGEFEQGLPVLELLQQNYPGHQFLITFFSPSGYEVKKGAVRGAGVCYLPMDTRQHAQQWVTRLRPEMALFVKYEVWPNYFRALREEGVPLYLISARFTPGQSYFKWYGGFLRQALGRVTHFYVQDRGSAALLESMGFGNVTVSGDTRFDRVAEIAGRDNRLDFMEAFRRGRTCLVAGSTWPEDERVILPLIRELAGAEFCFVIAPHQTDPKAIEGLMSDLPKGSLRYSQREPETLGQADVLVVDTIGLLTKIYSYADLAYVGGGFATGLHNTLEPAVFGIPVIIGTNFQGFREAEALVDAGGILPVEDAEAFRELAGKLLGDPEARREPGVVNRDFIAKSRGASVQIADGIRRYTT